MSNRLVVPRLVLAWIVLASTAAASCSSWRPSRVPEWEVDNPLLPIPQSPLGIESRLSDLPEPPTPARVRLGRWLFYDSRLSADGTVSCGTCHRPDQGFSETERVSTGVFNRRGTRKSPSFVNEAWTLLPHFFWDGRAGSLEEQALGPIANPVEMGVTHERMVEIVGGIPGYRPYFREAFGDDQVTKERIVQAIADYERTRLSGHSAWDRWQKRREQSAISEQARKGHEVFFGNGACDQCHLGENFTDSRFHNIGVGWDAAAQRFADEGRFVVTNQEIDRGAFKTPTLRDVSRHAPYMHDGSVRTLREVVELYNRGGTHNPWLSAKIYPLGLTNDEMDALVAFMQALDSGLPPETHVTVFPK